MASYKITLDDAGIGHLDSQRQKLSDMVAGQAATQPDSPLPWFAGYLDDIGSYILYLAIDHCRTIEHNRVQNEKQKEVQDAIVEADAHINAIEASAEEI